MAVFSTDPVGFQKYFIYRFKELSGNKYTVKVGKPDSHANQAYYEIYETSKKEEWERCRFHFEINWYNYYNKDNKKCLLDVTKLDVIAHIESSSENSNITNKIRTLFSKEKGEDIIIKTTVNVKFDTKEEADKSIQLIIDVLQSMPITITTTFQGIADIANAIIDANKP